MQILKLLIVLIFSTIISTTALECDFYLDGNKNYVCRLSNVAPYEYKITNTIDGYNEKNVTILISEYDEISALPTLDGYMTGKFENLRVLDISFFNVSKIAPTAFDFCKKLEIIKIIFNNLSELPVGVFKGCEKLSSLNLAVNSFSVFPADGFEGLETLEVLNMDHNYISSIKNEDFQHLSSLKKLSLNENQLMDFNINTLPNLEVIDLIGNKFEKFEVINFPKLLKLNLSKNKIKGINITEAASIEELDVSMNSLLNFPNGIFRNSKKLKILKMSWNSELFEVLNHMVFEGLLNLEMLQIKSCEIEDMTQFPFLFLENLGELDLSHNKIGHLTQMFSSRSSKKLETLKISANVLTKINSIDFTKLIALKILDLSHNFIDTIEPNSFKSLTNLEKLDLTSNQLKILEFNIFPTPNNYFVNLDMSYNFLYAVEENFFNKFSSLLTFNGIGNTCINKYLENIGTASPSVFDICYKNYENLLKESTKTTDEPNEQDTEKIIFTGEDLLITMICIIFIALLMIILIYYVNGLLGLRMGNEKLGNVVEIEKNQNDMKYQRF